MDWNNINLKSSYERDQNIIDPLNFDTLLLEVDCNIRDITKEAITKQFEADLQNRITSAREVFAANLENILIDAEIYRAID
tara:strand:+ start:1361 stop:1603 length:243 start_codon:yes stop_codon:yes gene_type:complete